MTAAEKRETKQRIIETARLLFAKHGFKGTSVRQIAEDSGANVAAINYHFGSKENLYWAVIVDVYEWMDGQMEKLTADSKDIRDFAQKLFRFMREHQEYAVATMKTFLSDQAPPPEEHHPYTERMSCEMGPPGANYIGTFIQKQNPEASPEAIEWMVMSLFSSVFHFAVITSCVHYQEFKQQHMPIEKIEANIGRMADALKIYMGEKKYW